MTQVKIAMHGTDVSNEISLLEYGLLVSNESHEDGSGSHFCVYRVDEGFDCGHIYPSDIVSLINGTDWMSEEDIVSFLEYTGCSDKDEFLGLPLVNQISDLLSYYGYENIFGSSYSQPMTEQEVTERYLD